MVTLFVFRSVTSFVVLSLLLFTIPIALSKICKKINACRCKMEDGSGVFDLWDLDNSDGKPRFPGITGSAGSSFTYNYNPCTPIKATGPSAACTGSNLCQIDSGTSPTSYNPCDGSDSSFTVDASNNVVITYKAKTTKYTRSSKVTFICDKNDKKGSPQGVLEIKGDKSSVYTITLSASSACLIPSASPGSSLSAGSIILMIFFPLVLLYLIIGILFNIYVRHKQSVPEVLPNHTFWADFPFLVKDGCVFSYGKLKYCCHVLYGKARDQEYQEI